MRPAYHAPLLIAVFAFVAGCDQKVDISAPTIKGETRSFTFAADNEGRVPAGWKVDRTGKGEGRRWAVVADESSPSKTGYVLGQLAVIAGKRQQLASVEAEPPTGQWHTLTISMKEDLIVCTVGEAQVAARDDTFRNPGSVGLWTKADARTRFDRFTITAPQVAKINE